MAQAASRDVDIAPPPHGPGTGHAEPRTWLRRLGVASPELVAAAVAGFSLGPMILLLAGAFSAPLAIPLGLLGAAVAVWVCGLPAEPATRRTLLCTAGAALIALAWFAYNVRYYAEDVYATRDPGTYSLAARWLMDHATLNIPGHPEVFGGLPHANSGTAGFRPVAPGVLHAQGNHLLPALMSLVGSVFGTTALLQANVATSALALFVFFGLVRRIVGAPLAMLAMTAMAVSMPFVYVSRDAYTEPLMLLFLVGGLVLLHRAVTSGRVADFALAGFVAGGAAMVRVDSYGALLAVVVAAIAVLATAANGRRRAAGLRAVAVLAGGAVPLAVGWLDVTEFSRQYYGNLRHYIVLQLLALFALVVVGPVIAWLGWRPGLRERLAGDDVRRRVTTVSAVVLAASFAFLASRPLWQETHMALVNVNLENMQRSSNTAVDGTRTYNEQSVNWLAMYLGWPTVVLAAAGYPVLVAQLVRRRAYALVGMLTMGLIMSGLYLWNCEITPDQPWAMRRFVPVVIPLLLVAAAAALRALWSWQRALVWARTVAVVSGVLMVAVPAVITWPMAHVRDEAGQLAQLRAICAAVGHDGAVVEVDRNARDGYGQAIRSYCGVPTIGLARATTPQLATMRAAAAAHGRRLFVLSQDYTSAGHATSCGIPRFSLVKVERWPSVINKAPGGPSYQATVVCLSTVDGSGLTHPVQPVR